MRSSAKIAVAYARVSTRDQATKDLSIPEQLREIEVFAESEGYVIAKRFHDDGISAFRDQDRPGFEAAMAYAESNQNVTLFLVHELTRFARNKHNSALFRHRLKKAGVSVVPVATPYDPSTIAGLWQESIYETQAQADSMMTAFHVRKGMRSNIHQRDPETGWCYKNGGRAAYGYKNVRVMRGKDSRGKDITKQLWMPDEETSPVLRRIVLEYRIEKGMSYREIRDALNEAGIPAPESNMWGLSTVRELFTEDRLQQYAGVAYWNKWAPRGSGRKFNPVEEWEREDDAHPALITLEEAETALRVNEVHRKSKNQGRANRSPYLLTGANAYGVPLFVCGHCGSNMTGFKHSKGYLYYRCNGSVNYGDLRCRAPWIPADVAEQVIISAIRTEFDAQSVGDIVRALNDNMREDLAEHQASVTRYRQRIASTSKEIDNLLTAVSKGLDASLVVAKVNALKAEHNDSRAALLLFEAETPELKLIDENLVMQHVKEMNEKLDNLTAVEVKQYLRSFIGRIVYNVEDQALSVNYIFGPLDNKKTRGPYPLVCGSDGVGGGTCPQPRTIKQSTLPLRS